MKPILLATDYLPAARGAGDYAAQLAKAIGVPLKVIHVWSPPAPIGGDSMIAIAPIADLEKVQQEAVDSECNRLSKTWGLPVEGVQRMGFAADEIQAYAEECDAEFVVMGIRHVGVLGRIFGCVATASLHHLKVPALIIPEGVAFVKPSTVLLATDLSTDRNWTELDELKSLADVFHFNIHVINVVKEEQVTTADQGRSGIRLENKIKQYPHTWHFPVDDNIYEAIGKTADKVAADWIAVVPHHQAWYQELFYNSVSKKMAFTLSRPMLALTGK